MQDKKMQDKKMQDSYKKLFIAISINAVIMFFLTFVLIDRIEHFSVNINRIYMALIMAVPMVAVMLLVMRSMFMDKNLNMMLLIGSVVAFVLLFFLMRTQTPVGNEQFLRSMIPHHSSAILMCERSNITDPQIQELCVEIVESQEEEIAEMEAILERY
jgi:signal transduction histidine kinase